MSDDFRATPHATAESGSLFAHEDEPHASPNAAARTNTPVAGQGNEPSSLAAHLIRLAGPTDLTGFRAAARRLIAAGITPAQVHWSEGESDDLLSASISSPFATNTDAASDADAGANADGDAQPPATEPTPAARLTVPPSFLRLCEAVVLHADPARFTLLYRLLWRMQREPGLRHDPLDADVVRAGHLAAAVRRDIHKMRAFVRFRPLVEADGQTLHVAWFEPAHHIVEANAPFFARRFANMRWAIFTPRLCARWAPAGQGSGELILSPGAKREDAPGPDAGEALWLTYYAHMFNPARLKLSMMQKEMPRKYWKNLPEAALIAPLAAQAAARTGGMVEAPATPRRAGTRTLPAAQVIPLVQVNSLDELRAATQHCRECPIGEHATQAVCGEGAHGSLMFVGEQPGDQEDLQGRPFVGPAGKVFDRALADLGVARDTLYIANAVKHFKFELRGKRRLHKTAGQKEALACLHWLEKEIELVQPQALVALGATATRSLLGPGIAVTRDRGQWFTRPDGRRVLVTLHPSALLRMEPQVFEEAYAAWLADLRLAFA